MEPLFLGGTLAPAGLCVSYLRAPVGDVLDRLTAWRRDLAQRVDVRPARPGDVVSSLEPFEAPWTRELLLDSGEWTAYLNNSIDGGDPTAAAPYLAQTLEIDLYVAIHTPLHGPGHASTQLWAIGPDGVPPLMHRRTISAHAQDGKWSWRVSGDPLPFERVDRYEARRIRDRLDRSLLIEYLGATGIRADDPAFYGDGFLVQQIVDYQRRQETAAQVLERYGS